MLKVLLANAIGIYAEAQIVEKRLFPYIPFYIARYEKEIASEGNITTVCPSGKVKVIVANCLATIKAYIPIQNML